MMQSRAQDQPRVIGRYILYREIASGGMATVHFGRLHGPMGFSRTVAVKRLHPQFARDQEFVAMFIDEARLAARIRHPNVVQTLDVVATEGELFLVMDYVQGESLARLWRASRAVDQIPVRVASAVICGALHGLHAAHEATDEHGKPLGLAHRDMSPQNILVGVDGIARVLDFGVAVAAGRVQSTGQGKIKGKFGYMAPEQIQGHATRQSDIFATSVVLWEVLTGMRLFPGDDPRQVLAKILSGEITKPRKLAPHLPVGVDEIVMRGLERDAARRYATAREMALDLEACLGLASPSQVGSWVEASARTELAKRAAAMAEIEHSSSQVVDVATLTRFAEGGSPASGVSLLPSDGRRPGDDSLDASQSETVHHGSVPLMFDPARRRARIRKRVVLGAAVIAVVAGASAFAISALHSTAGSGIEKSESSAMIQPASGTSPIIPPLESTPSPAAALPPHTESDLSARYAPESSTSSHATNTAPRPPPPSTRRSPTLDCDPPYSLDEQGHKHWKDACFRK